MAEECFRLPVSAFRNTANTVTGQGALVNNTKGSFTDEADFSSLGNALELRIELNRSSEMFFGQLVHSEIFQPEAEHPMKKRIIWSELIGLFFVRNGFFDSAQRSLGAGELIAD